MNFKEFAEKRCKYCINKKKCKEEIRRNIKGEIDCNKYEGQRGFVVMAKIK